MKQKISTIILSIVIFIVPILIIPIENQSNNLIRAILVSICGIVLIINFFINIKKNKFDEKDILILGFRSDCNF
ncbi:MAG: hypothetical protein IKT41_04965 [Clostridia bacterium]|nr:hypothetical protein [Clostridia bacterium]